MLKIICALLFGYLLVALEAIVPGGILGLLGFICLLASCYFAHLEFGGWILPTIIFLVGGLGGVALVFFQFKWLAQNKFGSHLFVDATSGVPEKPSGIDVLVGKRGIAQTDHHPEGVVRLGKKTYDSFCSSGFAPKGSKLEVTGVDSFRLIVRRY